MFCGYTEKNISMVTQNECHTHFYYASCLCRKNPPLALLVMYGGCTERIYPLRLLLCLVVRSVHAPSRLLLLPSLRFLSICVGYFHFLHLCVLSTCSSWTGLHDGVLCVNRWRQNQELCASLCFCTWPSTCYFAFTHSWSRTVLCTCNCQTCRTVFTCISTWKHRCVLRSACLPWAQQPLRYVYTRPALVRRTGDTWPIAGRPPRRAGYRMPSSSQTFLQRWPAETTKDFLCLWYSCSRFRAENISRGHFKGRHPLNKIATSRRTDQHWSDYSK